MSDPKSNPKLDLEQKLLNSLRDGRLPCAFAFRLASDAGVTPGAIGAEADRLGIRISRCQLGLFGYPAFRRKGFIQRVEEVPGDVAVSLRSSASDGKVPCVELWRISKDHGLPKIAVACAAETLDLQISPCQLGCF